MIGFVNTRCAIYKAGEFRLWDIIVNSGIDVILKPIARRDIITMVTNTSSKLGRIKDGNQRNTVNQRQGDVSQNGYGAIHALETFVK